MEGIADTIRLAVLHAFGWLLPTTLLVWLYVVLDSYGLNPFKSMERFIASIPPVGRVVLGVLLVGFIVYGSTKSGGDTNSPPSRMSAPRRTQRLADIVAPEDIARGWRVVTSAEAEGLAEMPAGAVTNDLLRRRGGYDWAFRVEPEGWRFPYRDGVLDGVTVLARGEVRPDVGTLYFPVPFTNGVSLLPEARWGLLDHAETQSREVSVFSHAVTTNGSLLLDWHNALVGRDVNSPTNLQMELFSDGSFAWRTDDGSTSYLPVFPFDYDGDGLENSVDPEPLSPNSIDAHGTNAEWCRIVCSKVFEVTGTTGVPPVDDDSTDTGTTGILPVDGGSVQFKTNVNSRAYYFVDVVASEGPAPIYFKADRDSRLGSPVVVARASETNRVPFLIGVEYTVTSTVPISVSAPDAMYATVTSNDARSVTVKWPLEFEFMEESAGTYTVNVVPYDPGGSFTWSSTAPGGGAMLFSAASSSFCGCWSGYGPLVSFNCSETCTCLGGCRATGEFTLEDAIFSVEGEGCRCGFDDPPHEEEPHYCPTDGPSFSVSFSKDAVIFEDAYEDSPGDLKPKRSTRVRLTVSAYGGPNGGTFVLTHQNLEKLSAVLEGPIDLPSSRTLNAGEAFYTTCVYEAKEASDSENDVYVRGYFIEDNTNERYDGNGELTVLQIEITPETVLPQNPVLHRHIFGLREKVSCRYHPSSANVGLSESDGNIFIDDDNDFFCPWTNGEYRVLATLGDANLDVSINVFTPIVECRSARWREELVGDVGTAGNVGMSLALYLQPSTVSFSYISLQEIPEYIAIPPSGYFAQTSVLPLTHSETAGAGRWMQPWPRNGGNYWTDDAVQMPYACPPVDGTNPPVWTEGTLRWLIPVGWGDHGALIDRMRPNPTTQVYHMTEEGTLSISKYLHTIMRSVDGRVWLDGSRVNAWWSGWL